MFAYSNASSRPAGRFPVAVALALALGIVTLACAAPDPTPDAAAELSGLADELWERQLEDNVQARIREGLPVEKLPEISYERASKDAEMARGVLERLAEIDRSQLDHNQDLTWEMLHRDASMTVEWLEHYWVINNVLTPYSSPIGGLRATFAVLPLGQSEDRDRYISLLQQLPEFVGTVEAHARGQMERGVVASEANMDAVVGIVRGSAVAADVGPFAVSDERLASIDDESFDGEEFRQRIAINVDEGINPALERFAAFLAGDYRAAAPAGVGLSQYPGGDEAYRFLVRFHTTMDIEPEEIHEIGLDMIDNIKAQMLEIQSAIGFEGSVDDFRQHIQVTPEYYPTSIEEVDERMESAANDFFAQVDRWFLTKPSAPFGARRLDPALEPSQTFGYYNPPTPEDPVGYYNFNGSNLNTRSWLNYAGVSFHELFPGHHFHITRQLENENLPDIRRNTWHGAYTEGWGMYGTQLGLESGLLDDDPLSQYGALMMEIFVADRLVVDTAMNALGWSLEETRTYMRNTIFESDAQIATESLRYSTDMPGQALGYMMGKREIVRLREHAREALGDRFDIRRFHEALLGPGSLPMTVLASYIDWFIEQELQRSGDGD